MENAEVNCRWWINPDVVPREEEKRYSHAVDFSANRHLGQREGPEVDQGEEKREEGERWMVLCGYNKLVWVYNLLLLLLFLMLCSGGSPRCSSHSMSHLSFFFFLSYLVFLIFFLFFIIIFIYIVHLDIRIQSGTYHVSLPLRLNTHMTA